MPNWGDPTFLHQEPSRPQEKAHAYTYTYGSFPPPGPRRPIDIIKGGAGFTSRFPTPTLPVGLNQVIRHPIGGLSLPSPPPPLFFLFYFVFFIFFFGSPVLRSPALLLTGQLGGVEAEQSSEIFVPFYLIRRKGVFFFFRNVSALPMVSPPFIFFLIFPTAIPVFSLVATFVRRPLSSFCFFLFCFSVFLRNISLLSFFLGIDDHDGQPNQPTTAKHSK
ncbi:hypothetical protein F4861DRAFT_217580 [Xylaria intraflava]|nr:hypothetical protein F4861DRAFT_217580 [Xylaria intraflava]